MEFLDALLPVVLYSLGIVLIIVLIVLGLKLIETVNKVNVLLDDTQEKLDSLNGFFNVLDTVGDKMAALTSTIVSTIINFFSGIVQKRKNKKEEESNE